MNAAQVQANQAGAAAERAYETWRGWAQEHALLELEWKLQGEGVDRPRSPGRPSLLARFVGWAMVAMPILIGVAVYLVWRSW